MVYLALARCERGVDDLDLVRMDGELAGEPVASRSGRLRPQAILVAEVDEYRVDRLHAGRNRREQAEIAREPIWGRESAVRLAGGGRAYLRRQILRSPGEPFQPSARPDEARHVQNADRHL